MTPYPHTHSHAGERKVIPLPLMQVKTLLGFWCWHNFWQDVCFRQVRVRTVELRRGNDFLKKKQTCITCKQVSMPFQYQSVLKSSHVFTAEKQPGQTFQPGHKHSQLLILILFFLIFSSYTKICFLPFSMREVRGARGRPFTFNRTSLRLGRTASQEIMIAATLLCQEKSQNGIENIWHFGFL